MKPYYKPPEDVMSPDGYTPKYNPYGPGGFIANWTPTEGLTPYKP